MVNRLPLSSHFGDKKGNTPSTKQGSGYLWLLKAGCWQAYMHLCYRFLLPLLSPGDQGVLFLGEKGREDLRDWIWCGLSKVNEPYHHKDDNTYGRTIVPQSSGRCFWRDRADVPR